ncbi:MAG: glycosyltransferase [Hyphomonadaceae bacterium]|nr:glycosyltransferase [Hyphomonadaceae bacterium]
MKILYVAGRWPWPVQVGRQRMIDQTLRLAAEVGEVHLLAFASSEASRSAVPGHVKLAAVLPMPGSLEVAVNVVTNPLSPLQCQLFNSRAARRELDAAIRRLSPDVVIIDMVRLYPLAAHVRRAFPRVRLVLDMDDLLSVRYARMLKNRKQGAISGTFEKKLPGPMRMLARALPRVLLHVERPLIARLERKAALLFDAILLVSPTEAGALAKANSGALVLGFPPVIEQRPAPARNHAASLRFVFIGNANYAPNAEALALLDRVAASLKQRMPAPPTPYRFETAGVANPALKLENIATLGFVDDLGVFLSGDAVLVAPILTGTGVKTKIVDALEYATPIVTTDIGAEGLPLTPGDHFIRVEGDEGLREALERLVEDASARADLARMGQAALDAAYGGANHGQLLSVLKRALGV